MPHLCNCIHSVLFDDMSKYIIHFLLRAIFRKTEPAQNIVHHYFLLRSVSPACEGTTIKCKYKKM